MRGFITKSNLTTCVSFFFLLLVWKVASVIIGTDLLLPPPEKLVQSLAQIFTNEDFLLTLLFTLLRGVLAFVISLAIGLLFGILAGLSEVFYSLIRLWLISIRSTPVIAVILLAIIWFTTDYVPVFTGFLMMFPIICSSVIDGIRSIDRDLVEMAEVYRIRRITVIKEVYLPAITPFLVGGISNAMGIGWKAVIASEVLSQPEFAIGTMMHTAQTYLIVSEVIAWTIVAVAVSYLFEIMLRHIEKKSLSWR